MKASVIHTEFAAEIRCAGITRADFAKLCGVTTTAASYWSTGRRAVPQWAWALCCALKVFEPDELLPEPNFRWYEVLGVSQRCSLQEATAARNRLVKKYHPDAGVRDDAMARINVA